MIADLKPYPEYKQSGLAWLGQVPEHWTRERAKWLFTKMERPVGDDEGVVTCFRDGMVTLRKNRRLRGFTEAIYELGYQGIRTGDLVIHAMDAFAGAVGVSDSDGKATPVYAVCQPKPGVNAHYYTFVIREMARSQWILALSRGIRERSTDFRYDTFGGQRVPLPPPAEQAAIVRFLDWANGRLERAIRAKRKVIALLNEQKQAIIHRSVTRGLDPSVPLKPSGIPWLGEIPEHWAVLRLKGVLVGRLVNGVFKRGDAFGSGVPLVNVANIYATDGRVHKERLDKVKASPREIETFRVLLGDLFFVRSSLKLEGTGRCAFVESVDPDTVFECHVVRARPDQRRIEPRFLAMFLSSWAGVNNTVSRANTVTMSTLAQGAINSLPIVVPPLVEQRVILGLVDAESTPLTTAITRLEREIDLLCEYRTCLVSDVVTGKLDVREAAARLPERAAATTTEDGADLSDETQTADEEAVV